MVIKLIKILAVGTKIKRISVVLVIKIVEDLLQIQSKNRMNVVIRKIKIRAVGIKIKRILVALVIKIVEDLLQFQSKYRKIP